MIWRCNTTRLVWVDMTMHYDGFVILIHHDSFVVSLTSWYYLCQLSYFGNKQLERDHEDDDKEGLAKVFMEKLDLTVFNTWSNSKWKHPLARSRRIFPSLDDEPPTNIMTMWRVTPIFVRLLHQPRHTNHTLSMYYIEERK